MLEFLKMYPWSVTVIFSLLTLVDSRFVILAILSLLAPLYFATAGKGRVGCTIYCHRRVLLHKLSKYSLNKKAPEWFRSKLTKTIIYLIVVLVFVAGVIYVDFNIDKVARLFLIMVVINTLVAMLLVYIYGENAWCDVCPLGNSAQEIVDEVNNYKKHHVDKHKNKNEKIKNKER